MTLTGSPRYAAERRREREMQYELLKFHRDQADPIATNITKKRVREPRVDLESNPFCADRQLADSYQQLNFNKNPRFYSVSVQDGARVEQNPRNHSSFINQSADLLANSRFDARARPEFSTLPPATSYTPAVAHFAAQKVVSVDPSNLRKPSNSKNNIESKSTKDVKASTRHLLPPGHDQYSDNCVWPVLHFSAHLTSQSVTFGHRPSVDDELERQDADRKKKARELELEKGYINYVYNPPHELKPGHFPPPDQTTAQLIDKYRKLAVGKMPDIF
ncbi:hypothetical protein JG687_00006048 [Phytophthora cactorum]|uniref:Uncharacterized protein n=1 Tax=Phytophthora cactorum TaxID=29920 RepID=A0A8T1UJ52_9STRA|nr:hypothetical protein JG687_00006048 [Phytophthora cactorum]